jgi:hypothetical protein
MTGPGSGSGNGGTTGPGRIVDLTQSPFEEIRHQDDRGDFWSARELMPLLGYDKWERFEDAIDHAWVSAKVAGHDETAAISRRREIGPSGRRREDFRLTRFAAYLIAMNGDPRKDEIAAAQAYFAIRTREAELIAERAGLAAPRLLSLEEAAAVLRQQYGLAYTVVDLTRAMRAAGVTRLSGGPKQAHFNLLWFNGSAWLVVAEFIGELAKILGRAEQRAGAQLDRGFQPQLQLDGVGQPAVAS